MSDFIEIDHVIFHEGISLAGFLHRETKCEYQTKKTSLNISSVRSASTKVEGKNLYSLRYFTPIYVVIFFELNLAYSLIINASGLMMTMGILAITLIYMLTLYESIRTRLHISNSAFWDVSFSIIITYTAVEYYPHGMWLWIAMQLIGFSTLILENHAQGKIRKSDTFSTLQYNAVKITFGGGETSIYNLLDADYKKVAVQLGLEKPRGRKKKAEE